MRTKKFIAVLLGVMFASLMLASVSSAYCGPGFSSKKSAIKYYQTAEGKKFLPSMTEYLIRKGILNKDEAIMSFLKSDRVVYTKTPKGYELDWNTLCKGKKYNAFAGNLKHSRKGVLAIKTKGKPRKSGKAKVKKGKAKVVKTEVQVPQPDGSIQVFEVTTSETVVTTTQSYVTKTKFLPFMKDYCRNLSGGDSWTIEKRSSKKSKKKDVNETRKLIRVIPAPTKDATPTPLAPPEKEKAQKNGELTPDNVDFVPGGKNSDPADNVSSKCKLHSTGLPVEPLSDGRCPVGSYGY